MKEQELNFSIPEDPTIISLEKKDHEKTMDIFKNSLFSLSFAKEQYANNRLDKGFAQTIVYSLEHTVCDFTKLFGLESNMAADKEKDYAKMRELNQQNRELRAQLGQKVTNEDLRERMKNIKKTVQRWWDGTGFSFIRDESFSSYGTFTFSASTGAGSTWNEAGSDIIRDEKENQKLLEEQGFQFTPDSKGKYDRYLIDNDHNRAMLTELVKEHFPTAEINKFEHRRSGRNNDFMQLSNIEVTIFNLDEI